VARLESPIDGADAAAQDASPFHALLNQGKSGPSAALMPAAGQVVIGTLHAAPVGGQTGAALVPGVGLVMVAHSLVPLTAAHAGHGVALSVLDGGTAIVLGLLWNSAPRANPEHAAALPGPALDSTDCSLSVTVDGHREVIEAAEELELRCGDACIVLTADGRIQLRGTYITSHATATQRIMGGSVHVN
jgi:hypothetical protein